MKTYLKTIFNENLFKDSFNENLFKEKIKKSPQHRRCKEGKGEEGELTSLIVKIFDFNKTVGFSRFSQRI
jgi:hypothetical protein